jgi:cellulose synthase/poly-beta-1,6-N-acetylglucosamine synthase-like glycosyltransferase
LRKKDQSVLDAADSVPVEIAFLSRHGVALEALVDAARLAARIGVEPAQQVIASGLVTEAGFYRALAAELRLPFREGDLSLRPGGGYGALLREGVAAVMPGSMGALRFAIAPSGRSLRRLLDARLDGRDDVAVTTPEAFASNLREAHASSLARHVAGLDKAGLARQSARTGSSRGQRITAALGIGLAAYCGTLAPLQTFCALAMLVGPVFLGMIVLRLAAVFERPDGPGGTPRWRVDDSRLPIYTVAVPLSREEAVLPQLTAALDALDYPKGKLDICMLVEEDDSGLRTALARLALPAPFRTVIVPAGEPRTKPRALNLALLEARGALFTIFDAEDIPEPQQLRLAAARFLNAAPDLACLQARLIVDNPGDSPLAALFALEYAGLFEVINPGLLRCQLPIMLGGTSNHFRTEAVRAIGGWDAWNVTEDADLGLRLVRAGYRMADLPSRTWEEAPITPTAWLRQRSRWIKGYIQTLVTHLREPLTLLREAGPIATLTFLALALGSVVTALGYPVFAAALVAAWHDGSFLRPAGPIGGLVSALALVVSVAGIFALFLPPALGALRRGAPGLLLWLPMLPLYYALVSVAAWIALYDYVARRHAWNKTTHGLKRSSIYRPLTGAAAIPPLLPPAAARY